MKLKTENWRVRAQRFWWEARRERRPAALKVALLVFALEMAAITIMAAVAWLFYVVL